jgi:Putative peptidoglycan binding domain
MPVVHAAVPARHSSGHALMRAPARAAHAHTVLASSHGKRGSRHSRKTSWKPTQQAPQSDRIQEIQSALSRDGYYVGEPSGRMDESTLDAMRHFQEANGANPSGKLDASTLQKLGLGSDVAGLSAPRIALPAPVTAPKPPSY